MEFWAWCKGTNGYPIVDAGMRELNQNGVYALIGFRIDCRIFPYQALNESIEDGEKRTLQKIIGTYELASNNGGGNGLQGTLQMLSPILGYLFQTSQTEKFW